VTNEISTLPPGVLISGEIKSVCNTCDPSGNVTEKLPLAKVKPVDVSVKRKTLLEVFSFTINWAEKFIAILSLG
jgi:hypothetical protein